MAATPTFFTQRPAAVSAADGSVIAFSHLLVRQHRVALQWRQVAVEQGSARSVVLTEDCTIDVMEAIAGHQSVSTGGTAETLWRSRKGETHSCTAA